MNKLHELYKELEHAFETKSTIILMEEDWNELKPVLQNAIIEQVQRNNVSRFVKNKKPLPLPRFK